jgi:hypothetical protein
MIRALAGHKEEGKKKKNHYNSSSLLGGGVHAQDGEGEEADWVTESPVRHKLYRAWLTHLLHLL